tara:strand:+ start:10200 stop:11201 length:1002 start_codon:yes stop_codon:yes gene_type:complete
MNCFETVWDLIKAIPEIDLDDFTLDQVVNTDYVFPKGGQIMRHMKTPQGKKEMAMMQARNIDYPLEGMDLPKYQPKNAWNLHEELRPLLGGSAVRGKRWDFLSAPGKMINRTFSLPTHMCNVGGELREVSGSVCEHCYAHGSNYNYNAVQQKLLRNYNALTSSDPVEWASAVAGAIPGETTRFPMFRFHDSGDLHSASHASMIADISSNNPDVMNWLPTREWEMIADLVRARGGDLPPNFVPRISLPMVNQTLDNDENERRGVDLLPQELIDLIQDNPQVDYSTVITKPEYRSSRSSVLCPASNPIVGGNTCADNKCSACYNPKVKATEYFKH